MFSWLMANPVETVVNLFANESTMSSSNDTSVSRDLINDNGTSPTPSQKIDCQSCSDGIDLPDPALPTPRSPLDIAYQDISSYESTKEESLPYFAPIEDDFMVVTNSFEMSSRPRNSKHQIRHAIEMGWSIGHEMCGECSDIMVETLDEKYDQLSSDCKVYDEWIAEHEQEEVQEEDEPDCTLDSELEDLKDQIKMYTKKKLTIDRKNNKIMKQIEICSLREEECHKKQLLLENTTAKVVDQETKTNIKALHTDACHLEEIESLSLYELMFKITTNKKVARINGVPLGIDFDPIIQNNWSEINAAWGQVLLLLSECVRIFQLEISDYKLIPCGAYSHIIINREISYLIGVQKYTRVLPLFCVSFGDANFNLALLGVLRFVGQMVRDLLPRYPDLKLPHTIEENGIRNGETQEFHAIETKKNLDPCVWTKVLNMFMMIIEAILDLAIKVKRDENNRGPDAK